MYIINEVIVSTQGMKWFVPGRGTERVTKLGLVCLGLYQDTQSLVNKDSWSASWSPYYNQLYLTPTPFLSSAQYYIS